MNTADQLLAAHSLLPLATIVNADRFAFHLREYNTSRRTAYAVVGHTCSTRQRVITLFRSHHDSSGVYMRS
jgi:hypothetical protein